jgi:hypothetical protein
LVFQSSFIVNLKKEQQGSSVFCRYKIKLQNMDRSCMHDDKRVINSRQWVVILFVYWIYITEIPYNNVLAYKKSRTGPRIVTSE